MTNTSSKTKAWSPPRVSVTRLVLVVVVVAGMSGCGTSRHNFYPPGPYPTTSHDWIAVDASSDGYSIQSNRVPITITCEPYL